MPNKQLQCFQLLLVAAVYKQSIHCTLTRDILILYSARSGTAVHKFCISLRTASLTSAVSSSRIIQLHSNNTRDKYFCQKLHCKSHDNSIYE